MNGRRLVVLAAVLAALTATVAPAVANHPDEQIVLPGATGAEGIAKGAGATFYAGDLFAGNHHIPPLRVSPATRARMALAAHHADDEAIHD